VPAITPQSTGAQAQVLKLHARCSPWKESSASNAVATDNPRTSRGATAAKMMEAITAAAAGIAPINIAPGRPDLGTGSLKRGDALRRTVGRGTRAGSSPAQLLKVNGAGGALVNCGPSKCHDGARCRT
jgi:hypothetical protein